MPLGPSAPRLAAGLRIACLATLLMAVATSALAQGSISGTVTSSTTLLGLPGTGIDIYDAHSGEDPIASTVADGTGHYSINLPAGSYAVGTQNIAGYVNKIWNNVPCSSACDLNSITPVVVTNTAITGIDFVLDPGGRIAGRVTDSGTGLGIPGVLVYFVDSAKETAFTTAVTDSNGNYLSDGGSVTGNVYAFTSNALGYQNEVYDNKKCFSTCMPDPISVVSPVTTTGIDYALDPGGSFSGTVRDAQNNPLANVQIEIRDANDHFIDNAVTDGAGNYHTPGLTAGTYYAIANAPAPYVTQMYNGVLCPAGCNVTSGTGIPITVPNNVAGIDFVLTIGGNFTGTVTNASNAAPLADVFVSIADSAGFFVGGSNTNASGVFTTDYLQPGTYYAQIFSPAGFYQQLYNNLPCTPFCNITQGTPIHLAPNATVQNINFALMPSANVGSISGTVTNTSTGLGVNALSIQIFNSLGTMVTSGTTLSDGSGSYTIGNLPPGSYYVKTNTFVGPLINQVYNGIVCVSCTVTTSGGTLVVVTTGNVTTGINFALSPGGRISGTITKAFDGNPPPVGIGVQVFSASGVQMGSYSADAAGSYITAGLPAGTYYLRTTNSIGFINELYDNIPCVVVSCTVTNGTAVVVVGTATTTGRNFALDLGGVISGTVTSAANGTPVSSIQVQVFTAAGFSLGSANTDGSGNYRTSGLPAGSYFLRTSNPNGFIDEVYDDLACTPLCIVTKGTPIAVTIGATTAGKNFALTPGGAVSGDVTDAGTTNPLGSVGVGLYTPGGVFVKAAATNAGGLYTIGGLPPGTYYARTNVGGGQNYLDELYNEMACAPSCTVTSGAPIVVPVGVTISGRNFTLAAGGGAISGTLTDASTSGLLSGIQVQVYTSGGTLAKFTGTNASGVYTISGLPAGNYYVRTNIFNGLNYLDELYNNKLCFPTCDVTTGTAVAVVDGATTNGIDFALDVNLVQNSHFDPGTLLWKTFAAPDNAHMISSMVNGVFNWKRIVQDPGTPVSQATIFYETGLSFTAGEPLLAQFDLANTAATLKVARVLLVADSGFTDFDACTFALPPDGVMRTYTMKGRTTATWTNATIYFYATTPFTVGEAGNFQLDNVSLRRGPNGQSVTKTECIDPLTPGPGIGAPGGNMLTNGDFASGALAPGWGTFGTITVRNPMVGNVAEFIRPANTHPPGVLLQPMTPDIPAQTLMTLSLQLGNSSGVRKRALVLVHDNDFSSFVACAWWMAPGQGLGTYTMIFRNSELWTDPTVAIYPSTIGPDTWFRLDNVSLQLTPAASTAGTECIDPGGSRPADSGVIDVDLAAAGLVAPAAVQGVGETGAGTSQPGGPAAETGAWTEMADGWQAVVMTSETSVLGRTEPVDLTGATGAHLTFESWLSSLGSKAHVQVSVDGVNWISVAVVGSSDTWQPVDIDLGAFAGETVSVRFVLDGVAPADATMPDVWRIRDIAVNVNGG